MSDSNDGQWYDQGLRFQCTQCGNCCTGPPGYVWCDDREAQTLAAHLGLTVAEFRRRYAHQAHGRWTLNEQWNEQVHGYDCVFLRRDPVSGKALCSVYEHRPNQCRTWPFWELNLQSHAHWHRAARDCPGMNTGRFYPVEQVRVLRDRTPPM